MNGIRRDLRSVPFLMAVGLVLLAVLVLLLRSVCLLVCVVTDGAQRVEVALSGAAGIGPLAASVVIVPGRWEQ